MPRTAARPVCSVCARSPLPRSAACPSCGSIADPASTAGAGSAFESGEQGQDTTGRADGRRERLPRLDAWRAVIGERQQARYLRRFEALSRPGAPRFGWHGAALFVTGFWLLYRKMWGWAAVYLLGLPVLVLAERQLQARPGAPSAALDGLLLLVIAAWLIAPGLVADRLYLAHCNRLIDRVVNRRRREAPRHRSIARLAARGGTSAAAVAAAGVLFAFGVAGVVAGLVLEVAADYAKREKVVEALRIGAGARAAVGAFVGREGAVPANFAAAGFVVPALPAHVARLALDPRNGTIEIGLQVSNAELGAIYLVPQADAARHAVVWSCHADPAIEAYTPPSCQTAE